MADNIVETIFVKLGLDGAQFNSGADKAIKKNDTLNKSIAKTDKVTSTVGKTMSRWFAGIASATGLARLIDQVQQLNDELYHLEKNLGMSATTIKAWQGAAGAMGGSAEGMTSSMKSLNMQMNDFVIMGDTSLLPFMNALGVSMVDAQGKLRETDQVMLDLADSFSKIDREQALSLSQKMGIDEGTFNTLVQGRQEMEKMIEYQKTMYQSSEKELQASRELSKNRALLGQHWESLKTMLANVLIPVFVKLSEVALGIFEYLQKHQKTVQAVFTGLAFVIGMVLTPILVKAAIAALAFMAPFLPFIATVTALGAAFGLLYDDYKAWAEGGNSLFNWGAFTDYIEKAELTTNNLSKAFRNLGKDLMNDTIPTLVGYAEIVQMLSEGNFKGAAAKFGSMAGSFSDKVTGYADTALGLEQGTTSNKIGETISNVMQGGGKGGIPNKKGGNFNSILMDAAKRAGITDKKELAAFTAIVGHETGDGRNLTENANYSYKGWKRIAPNQRNVRNWLKNHSEADFKKLSKEDKLNIMYEGMNGNRKGEGYKFRGRGAIQLTGRANYQAFANAIGRPDIMDNPDLVASDPELAAASAAWFWKNNKKIGARARSGDIRGARKIVNGGSIGMDDVIGRYQASMRQGSSLPPAIAKPQGGSTVRNDVNVQNVTINTSASTMSGTGEDMARGIGNQVGMLLPAAQ